MTASKKVTASIAAVLAMSVFGLSSCSSDDSSSDGEENVPEEPAPDSEDTPVADESVLVLDGVSYTCGQVIGAEGCGPDTQEAFDNYKENILVFVNSGSLGPVFNNSSFEDAAFAGLVACAMVDDGQEAYVEYMQSDPAFSGEEGVAFLPPWFEAQKSLCPAGYASSDLVAP